MRGHEINGVLDNGDWVELLDQPEADRVYQPKEIFNLTLGAPVKSRMRWLQA
jgi:hypothetical protein